MQEDFEDLQKFEDSKIKEVGILPEYLKTKLRKGIARARRRNTKTEFSNLPDGEATEGSRSFTGGSNTFRLSKTNRQLKLSITGKNSRFIYKT